MAQAGEHQFRTLAEQDGEREATWRARALNAEDALKAAHTEILAQRTPIGEPDRRTPRLDTRLAG
ncbi:hypothetical protein GCM10010383_72930 [Streptomyces lomondensis]|uniref:Uncharacterized protein n=1 Tax=Streptomyces lomondensis TaxID=68229 RepID=A0ABQ2XSG6_9ACTN|nr:hypothetical protein GCM10010383_72930 [Streptomyces lomondensis]